MDSEIKQILSGDPRKAIDGLNIFIKNNLTVFNFNELNQNNVRKELWKAVFTLISDGTSKCNVSCLVALRILSRDKTDLDQLITEDRLDLIIEQADLIRDKKNPNVDYNVAVEALKCLCNIIYNSRVAAAICGKNKCAEGIIDRLRTYRDPGLPLDIKIFDMKLLFLLTALCEVVRPKINSELHGLKYIIDELKTINPAVLLDPVIDFICEILKVLFNLTLNSNMDDVDEEEEHFCLELVCILRNLLLTDTENINKRMELYSNIINLLTNMPKSTYKVLIFPVKEQEQIPKSLQFEEHNMKAIHEILNFLKTKFTSDLTVNNQQDLLSPILSVLLKAVDSSREIRKYLRSQILPPLQDVHNRPEQGNTLRNCLCRLLTSPVTNVRDLTADLLFIICKENVNRMIKYTGYGNAAGLFAQRGLLGNTQLSDAGYSSDSGDSDTEEYREHKYGINPVTGCYEPPHPSATENMTEEQKEYEAMKLVELMDNLTRRGIVKPCRIGEDGRPQPLKHVLELQEHLPNQQVHINDVHK